MKKQPLYLLTLPLLCSIMLARTGQAWADEEFVVVDLLVNVLKDVKMTDEQIENAVKEANKILKQANVQLEFDKKNIQRDFNDQGNNNNKIENGEDGDLDKKGVEELEAKFGKGKGFKIVITDQIHGTTNTGLSPHNPDMPVTYITPREKAGDADRGQTLAHEFAHVFTLGKGHTVDDHDTPGTADDDKSDGKGHVNDKKNLMYPTTEGGTDLTDDQKDEIKKKAKKRAKTKVVKTEQTLETVPSTHSSWTHPLDPLKPPFIDLYCGTTFMEQPGANLQTVINLGGLFPKTPSHAQYAYFFNTDNNNATGIIAAGIFPGIDKVVFVEPSGLYPFTGSAGSVQSRIVDVASNQITPLPPGVVERIYKIRDNFVSGLPGIANVYDSIHQDIPISLLNIPPSVPFIQGGIQTYDFNTELTEQRPIAIQVTAEDNIAVAHVDLLAGTANDLLQVAGEHYTPNSGFNVLVDDTVVKSGIVAGDGTLNTSFDFPVLPGANYFVTVRDDSGRSDYSIFHNNRDSRPIYDVTGVILSPTILETRFQDADSGLKSIAILQSVNFQSNLPVFASGTRNPVVLTANKINPLQNARLRMRLTDISNRVFLSDTHLLNLTVSTAGKSVSRTLTGVSRTKNKFRIRNGEPGLNRLSIVVNTHVHTINMVGKLESFFAFPQDMMPGNTNTIKIIGRGSVAGNAEVAISN